MDNPGSSTIGPASGTQSNFGSFSFNPVTFTDPNNNGGGNVTVTPTIDFRLSDVTSPSSSPTAANQAATVLYELSLDTQGVNGDNQGSVLSFVGFDFNGNGLDQFFDGEQIVGGFTNNAAAQVAIRDVTNANRVLSGDYNFEQNVGGSTAPGTNTNVDVFNGAVNNQSTASTTSPAANPSFLDLRTNGTPDFFTNPGNDISFGPYNEFQVTSARADGDGVISDTTAGVIQFRTVLAANTVPEPSALLMASMGLGMVAFRRRRKQQA